MSPMTTEEENRLRAVENAQTGTAERCNSRHDEMKAINKRIDAVEDRMGKADAFKDKFMLAIIGMLIVGMGNLAIALIGFFAKK